MIVWSVSKKHRTVASLLILLLVLTVQLGMLSGYKSDKPHEFNSIPLTSKGGKTPCETGSASSAPITSNATSAPYYYHAQSVKDLNPILSHIPARAFPPWPHADLPCFPPLQQWWEEISYAQSTQTGLLLAKTHKTGSTTAASIHLRLARNIALRSSHKNYSICAARFDHLPLPKDAFPHRHRHESFLWTIVREPTQRLISAFFFFQVTRNHVPPLDQHFQEFLQTSSLAESNYYAQYLSLRLMDSTRRYNKNNSNPTPEEDTTKNTTLLPDIIESILKDYDFVAVAERMDESAVVLSMLLNVSLADVLYLSSKASTAGHFDTFRGICSYIVPSFVSPGMQTYFASPVHAQRTLGDRLVYAAAEASLDRTIDALGRSAFAERLQTFRHAQQIVQEQCAPRTRFPCAADGDGRRRAATHCLWKDAGCGLKCLDQVATELDLWGPSWAPIREHRRRGAVNKE